MEGVGELVRTACVRGRAANAGLELGVCGEHGGEPKSIQFFNEVSHYFCYYPLLSATGGCASLIVPSWLCHCDCANMVVPLLVLLSPPTDYRLLCQLDCASLVVRTWLCHLDCAALIVPRCA